MADIPPVDQLDAQAVTDEEAAVAALTQAKAQLASAKSASDAALTRANQADTHAALAGVAANSGDPVAGLAALKATRQQQNAALVNADIAFNAATAAEIDAISVQQYTGLVQMD